MKTFQLDIDIETPSEKRTVTERGLSLPMACRHAELAVSSGIVDVQNDKDNKLIQKIYYPVHAVTRAVVKEQLTEDEQGDGK